jgi:hypothetical protein
MTSRQVVTAGLALVTLWALLSTAGFVRIGDRPRGDGPAETREAVGPRPRRVQAETRARVRSVLAGAGLDPSLVLTAGRPRSVTTSKDGGRGIFAETVYRVGGKRVILRQSTAAPPGARVRSVYVPDVPGTAQSPLDFYWADRGFILSLSRTAAGSAGDLRWYSGTPEGAHPSASADTAPRIKRDPIPYPKARKRQMARYSKRHYGKRAWRLIDPPVLVLHLTAGESYRSAWNHFASNAPNRGELPGVCAHFIIGKRGNIYRLVRLGIRCRHAIGLNHRSIGIEMVQEIGSGSHWAATQVLRRRPQIRAALGLTRYLRERFGIRMRNLIGHAMANDSPYFKDLEGWRNDHTDWLARDVRKFRKRLRRLK